MLGLMITYFSTWQAAMVTRAISKEVYDLIQGDLSPQNHGVAREGAARVWIPRVSYLPDPAWRDPGTERRDGRGRGC